MKTPREVLLERHQAATLKLDAIRRAALEKLNNEETKEPNRPFSLVAWFFRGAQKFWYEQIWPCRQTWAGLAAVWLVILTLQLMSHDRTEEITRNTPPPSPEMLLVLRQQRLLLAELVGRPEPPKASQPRPRTNRCQESDAA